MRDTIAKIISLITVNRLTKHLSNFGMDKQCGCVFGKGCVDVTFSIKAVLETLRGQGQDIHVLFVNLIESFDSANQELLWKIKSTYGEPKETINTLKKSHIVIIYILPVEKKK